MSLSSVLLHHLKIESIFL